MSKHLVLSVKHYDFENKQGERIKGAKISYINKKPTKKEGEVGFAPLMVSINNKELLESLKEVPAVYELDFEQITGKNNKPELMLTDIDLIAPVDLTQFF